MPRYWARWYEPATDSWEKAREVLTKFCGDDSARMAIAALRHEGFEVEWPYFTLRNTPHMLHCWQSGQSMSGSYAVVCALFDAPDEQTVRDEIGPLNGISIDLKADDWLPGGRFPIQAEKASAE